MKYAAVIGNHAVGHVEALDMRGWALQAYAGDKISKVEYLEHDNGTLPILEIILYHRKIHKFGEADAEYIGAWRFIPLHTAFVFQEKAFA